MNTRIVLMISLIYMISTVQLKGTSILASSFGWNGTDDTQALYNVFTANADTIYVDLQVRDWVAGPLIFDHSVNNKVVIFERDVKVRALPGAYDSYLYNGLFTFINCSDVSLIGYQATLQMNKLEYMDLNDGSEWRHIIALKGCQDFDIIGFELIDSGGDGIEVSGIWEHPIPSTNIHIKDCRIDNNYRQGISITSARNLLIEHCEITNTAGTPPAFGIDLEPDNVYDEISGILIKSCRITGNEGGGMLLAFWKLNQNSVPVSVDVSDCYIGANQNKGIVVDVNSSGPVTGYAFFNKCFIENQPGNGIFSNKRESLVLTFKDLVIRNVGTYGGEYDMPIFIQKQYDYSGIPVGGLIFDNIFIDDNLFNRDFMSISHWGQSTQVENVNGIFFIYNPNGATYSIDPPLVNINVIIQSLPSLPLANLSVSSNDFSAYEAGKDTTASIMINRSAGDISFPLGIHFDVKGTAENRLDYNFFSKTMIIPADSADVTYTFTAIKDELTEPVESIDLNFKTDGHYTVSNGGIRLFIGGIILGENETQNTVFRIYPNPVKRFIAIQSGPGNIKGIRIFNLHGQLVKTFSDSGKGRLDVSSLPPGVYFLRVNMLSGTASSKFIKK